MVALVIIVITNTNKEAEERALALASGKFPVIYQLGHLGQLFKLSECPIKWS